MSTRTSTPSPYSTLFRSDLKTRNTSGELFGRCYVRESANIKWFNAWYRPELESGRASPLRGDQSGTPSTLILTAGLDPLRDHGRSYAQACIEQGVPVVYREAEGNIHGFINKIGRAHV